jgi:hypothetical protein
MHIKVNFSQSDQSLTIAKKGHANLKRRMGVRAKKEKL